MRKFNLSDVKPVEVSLVDAGAIRKEFVIFKNKNGESKFYKGEMKTMKLEELIELGLVDENEVKGFVKKDEKGTDVIANMLAAINKMLTGKVDKTEVIPVEKMTEEEKKKLADEKAKADAAAGDVKKLQEQVDKLTKDAEGNNLAKDLLAKLGKASDPKEFLKVLKEVKDFSIVTEPEPTDANGKMVKVLDGIAKRLETIELSSKGLKGQESTEQKKSGGWGGAFR